MKGLTLNDVYTTEEALGVLGLAGRDSYFLYRQRDYGNLTRSFKRGGRRWWIKREVDGLETATPLALNRPASFTDLLDLSQVRDVLGKANGRRSVSKEHVYAFSDLRDGPLATVEIDAGVRFWLRDSVRRFLKNGKRQGSYPRRAGRPARGVNGAGPTPGAE